MRGKPGAYSLVEMLIAVVIIQVISSIVMYSIQTMSDSSHLDLITKRTIGLLRSARMLAMSSGTPCNVDFDTANRTVKVYLGAAATPVSNSLFPSGQCALNLTSDQGIAGTSISAVNNAATTSATVYRCTYGILGTRTNAPAYTAPMTVSYTYGGATTVLTIPNAGDPY